MTAARDQGAILITGRHWFYRPGRHVARRFYKAGRPLVALARDHPASPRGSE
jgi:hypothetical protein